MRGTIKSMEGMFNLIEAIMQQARVDAERLNKENPTEKDLELGHEASEFIENIQAMF